MRGAQDGICCDERPKEVVFWNLEFGEVAAKGPLRQIVLSSLCPRTGCSNATTKVLRVTASEMSREITNASFGINTAA